MQYNGLQLIKLLMSIWQNEIQYTFNLTGLWWNGCIILNDCAVSHIVRGYNGFI